MDTAISSWQHGDQERTEKIITLLLQVLKQGQKYSSVDENLVHGLYRVAEYFCTENEHGRAEWLYLQVLESQEDILGPDNAQALETLTRLNQVVVASVIATKAAI